MKTHGLLRFLALLLTLFLAEQTFLTPSTHAAIRFGESATYPAEPYNGLQVRYTLQGATLHSESENDGWTPTLIWRGSLNRSGALRLSGTAKSGNGWYADLNVSVSVNGATPKTQNFTFSKFEKSGNGYVRKNPTREFDVSMDIPAGATKAEVRFSLVGNYNAGSRAIQLIGTFTGYSGANDRPLTNRCVQTFDNGSRYDGVCSGNQQPNGIGTMVWRDGTRYEGNWVNGVMQGYGVMTWPNGARYSGGYANGRRQGRGVYTWPNGASYKGEYMQGNRHGWGTMIYADRTRYVGGWAEGKRSGNGTLYAADGSILQQGRWKNGKFVR